MPDTKTLARVFPFIEGSQIGTFLINLYNEIRYRPLSFRAIAGQLANRDKEGDAKP